MVKKTRTIGIDYSLNSPAVCINDEEEFDITKCKFHFLTTKKKYQGNIAKDVYGEEYPLYKTPEERFDGISNWVLSLIKDIHSYVYIEGYSYGSKGQGLFQIAENGGLLKHKLWKSPNVEFNIIVPSVVKKRATGKGNADKQMMYEQFMKDGGTDLVSELGMNKLNNPVTDIVDAYYIMRTGYENRNSN